MEERLAEVLEEGTVQTNGSRKEKRKRTAKQTSQRPRRRNTIQPATLQEKRGSLRTKTGRKLEKKEGEEEIRNRNYKDRETQGKGSGKEESKKGLDTRRYF
ncbi:hypothetical protein NDU88_002815 [Pleurodeles waltl]|uniref:Uncharacterized protein n=1 Tax=Pleurodeles waltl TaxID=8319 RepID=A0AAV7UC62_PLEWA|nr:hypothetical protein NDU88_002815 [Pleurodeles waltl]